MGRKLVTGELEPGYVVGRFAWASKIGLKEEVA
jgi:hypothetical protein